MKVLMVVVLVAVLGALASAGFFMLKRDPGAATNDPAARDRRMARALAVRVGLCVALFIIILISWAMGWVRPGGLPVPA
jgi:Protein of unknown function (DUF2909)